jgi:DNA-binding IclR family transcriptional regulator
MHPLQKLVTSPKLRDQPMRVLMFVLPDLSLGEYKPIKQEYVARSLQLHQPQVSRSLKTLVNEGLLLLGPREGPSNTYSPNPEHPLMRQMYNAQLYNPGA